jgi:tetratricopeptide (TPR) repeat protein
LVNRRKAMFKKRLLGFGSNFVVFIFLLGFSFSSGGNCAGCLDIRIWSDKYEYLTREPILVDYEVKNISDTPVRTIFDLFNEHFNIKDQDGRGYSNLMLGSYASFSDTLKPGESYKGGLAIDGRYQIVSQGEYICYMEIPKDLLLPFCSEKSKSNPIKIKVKDPEGTEKKALELYLEAGKLKYARNKQGRKDLQKRELGFLKYQELVGKYPNSIYAPLALRAAIGVYLLSQDSNERRKIIPLCIKLIEDYPDFYDFVGTFTDLVDTYKILKDKEGAIRTMKELIEKHPNTKISERAEYWLKQVEKWEFK